MFNTVALNEDDKSSDSISKRTINSNDKMFAFIKVDLKFLFMKKNSSLLGMCVYNK